MNGHVNIFFKRFDFWPLVLIDDILKSQVVDLQIFLKKAQLRFGRRIEMKPEIGVAARQKLGHVISTDLLKAVSRCAADG